MKFEIIENYKIGKIVTFVPNKTLPIYNWFYYKEGYSREFMEYAYKKLKISNKQTILDPFLGSGTTCLYAKEMGNKCFGRDVNHVALLASKAKTYDYETNTIKELFKNLNEINITNSKIEKEIENLRKINIIKKAYPLPVLEQLIEYKHKIKELDAEQKYKDFFMVALMNTSTITTYAEKHGGAIKINKKRKFAPPKIVFKKIIKKMISDLERVSFKGTEKDMDIRFGDARELDIENESIDVVITSPPYLNKIEYTNVYALEQIIFLEKQSKPAVRSFIGEYVDEQEDVFNGKYPLNNIARAYFKDMDKVAKEWSRILKDSAKGAVVIGNGCFPNGVVESDKLFSEILENYGFKVEYIERVNKRMCMRSRTIKVAPMHESIIWFRR